MNDCRELIWFLRISKTSSMKGCQDVSWIRTKSVKEIVRGRDLLLFISAWYSQEFVPLKYCDFWTEDVWWIPSLIILTRNRVFSFSRHFMKWMVFRLSNFLSTSIIKLNQIKLNQLFLTLIFAEIMKCIIDTSKWREFYGSLCIGGVNHTANTIEFKFYKFRA